MKPHLCRPSLTLRLFATLSLGALSALIPSRLGAAAPPPPPAPVHLVIAPAGVTVDEGGTATFQVSLDAKPAYNVNLSVTRLAGGDADLSVKTNATFGINRDDWATPVTVTLQAAEDADATIGSATFQVSETTANAIPPLTMTATEFDNDNCKFLAGNEVLPVTEGSSSLLRVWLDSRPTTSVTFTVTRISGDTDLSVSGGTPGTLTPSNWSSGVTVSFSAAGDVDTAGSTAVIRLHATNATIPDYSFVVREIDTTAGSTIPAGGTISANTTWNDTTKDYELTSQVVVPAGVTLTIGPGVRVRQSGIFAAFSVNGTLRAQEGATFILLTRTPHDYSPGERINAITIQSGGTGDFNRAAFQGYEISDQSTNGVDHYNLDGNSDPAFWATLVNAVDGSSLTARGCVFEGLTQSNNYSVPYGIHLTPAAAASITDSTTSLPAVRSEFRNTQAGMGLKAGAGIKRIDASTFAGCTVCNIRVWGDVQSNLTLRAADCLIGSHNGSSLVVKNGATLTMANGSGLRSAADRWLTVENGGQLILTYANIRTWGQIVANGRLIETGCTHWCRTNAPHDYGLGERRVGVVVGTGGIASIERTAFQTYETSDQSTNGVDHPNQAYWNGAVHVTGTGLAAIRGCQFQNLSGQNGWRTPNAIRADGTAALILEDSVTPAPAVPNSFDGYQSAIEWECGAGNHRVELFNATNCTRSIRIWGESETDVTLNNTRNIVGNHNSAYLKMKSGAELNLGPNADLSTWGWKRIIIDPGAEMNATGARLSLTGEIQVGGSVTLTSTSVEVLAYAPPDYDQGRRNSGLNLLGGGGATLRNCSFYFNENQQHGWWSANPNWGEWSAMIYARLGAGFTIDHCAFNHAYHPVTGYPVTYAIRTETKNNWSITNCVFAKNYVALGIYDLPSSPVVSNNDFLATGNYAIYNATGTVINVPNNYWGDPSGPTHMTNPGGVGGRVSDNVNYAGNYLGANQKSVEVQMPSNGQEITGLTTQSLKLSLELYGLRGIPNASHIDQIAFRLSSPSGGMAWSKIFNFRLGFDADNDGNIGYTETTLAGGTATTFADGSDLVILFSQPFVTPASGSAGYILLADVEAAPAGSGFTVGLDERYLRTRLAYGILSRLNAIRETAGAYVTLADPRGGQEQNNLTGIPEQQNVEVYGFRLLGFGRQVERVDFQFSGMSNWWARKFTSLRLYMDSNMNGKWDAADALVSDQPNGQVYNSNGTGSITFTPTPSLMPTGVSYLLVGDVWHVMGGDSITVNLAPGNIDLVGNETVAGGWTQPATHTAPGPILLTPAPGWSQPATFKTATNYQLLAFQLDPTGRTVDGLIVELSSIFGIVSGDLTSVRLYNDRNSNNLIDGSDLLLASGGQVDIQGTVGSITFPTPFTTRGRMLLVANTANIASGDEMSVAISHDGVMAAGGLPVAGDLTPVRHLAGTPPQEGFNKNMKWTLAWRSPGGTSGSGRFNHAGDRVIIGYDTGSAWIYDTANNTPLIMLKEHYDSVRYAGFSSDDSAAVTVSKDGAVYIWDLHTSGTLRSAMFADLLVDYAVPSPDFRKLMVITQGKGMLLDLDTQQRLWEFIPGSATVNAIAYSPDGKYIALGCSDKKAYIVNASDGNIKWPFIGHSQSVTGVAFTSDGKKLMTASTDATVQMWAYNSATDRWSVSRSIPLSGQNAQGAAVSNDGQRVCMITGYGDSAYLRMFDGNTGLELYQVNLNSATGNNWGYYLENVTFDNTGERVMVTSSGEGWCQNACFRVSDGAYLKSWGPFGRMWGDYGGRTRVSMDGERIFYNTNFGMNLLRRQNGKTIRMSPYMPGDYRFGVDAAGDRMAFMYDNYLRVDSVSESGFAPLSRSYITDKNNWHLSMSPDGRQAAVGDWLFNAESGALFANYSGIDGNYVSNFSHDGHFWGFAMSSSNSLVTLIPDDPLATLYRMVHTDPYSPFKLLWHPDHVRVGCVDRGTGAQFYDMDQYGLPVGLYRFDAPDNIQDADISEDGSMLLIGGHNVVKLYDVLTGRVLRYFYPMHSSLTDVWVNSVQFARHDTQIAIAWNYNYVEIYERSQAKRIEVTPAVRKLAPGQSQAFQVEIVYDDTTRRDVTPRADQEDTSVRLEIIPPAKAAIVNNVVTVANGATGSFIVRARYREDGQTMVGDATVTIGAATLLRLVANPDKLALTPGVFRPINYTAYYNDGYEADVTAGVSLAADKPEDVEIDQQNVKVLYTARPGRITVTGSYQDPWNAAKTAQTVITVFGPRTAWERFNVTGGGYGTAGAISPNGTQFAAGSSSGAINLYACGATPTQFALRNVIQAHSAPVMLISYLDDANSQILSVGQDGALKIWAVDTPSSVPLSVYEYDAQIECAALAYQNGQRYAVVGDSLGRVSLIDLNAMRILWQATAHDGGVRSVAIDGDTVLSGGGDGRIKVFERANGRLVVSKSVHTKPIVKVGFLPLSNGAPGFYSLSEDKTLVRWNKSNQTISGKPFEYSSTPTTAAVIGSDLYVATSGPPAAWVYNRDGLLLRWLELPPAEGSIVHMLAYGGYLMTGRSTGKKTTALKFMGLDAGEVEVSSPFSSFQFFEAGRGIYRGSLAHSFPMTSSHADATGTRVFTQDPKRTMSWTLSENTIATATRLMETGYFIAPAFEGMDFTADSNLLVTRVGVSHYMFNTQTNLLWKTLHTPVNGGPFSISPLGTRFVTADSLRTRLWDLANLAQIEENTHLCSGMDFIGETKFLGPITADKFLGMFNASNIMDNGVITRHPPVQVTVNRAKDRAIIISREVRGGGFMEPKTYDYYTEIYDIKNLAIAPRLLFDIYLLTITEDPFSPTALPSFSVAVSEDTGMALVAASGDRPVKLIQLTDGTTIREFLPPQGKGNGNLGACSVEFLPNDLGVMIGWGEGFAELWRRVPPQDLGIQVSAYVPPKAPGKPAQTKPLAADEFSRYKVRAGQTLWIESLARYINGDRLNVTPSTAFTSSASAVAVINGSIVTISPTAVPQVVTISATYTEVGRTLTSTIELEIVGTPIGVTGLSRAGYVVDYLDPGKKLYGDANSTFTQPIPNDLLHQLYIRTLAADANSTVSSFLSFNVNQAVRVVIAIDSQITNLPAWLSTWTELSTRLNTTDTHPSRRLFEKFFPAGKITLGPNRNASGGTGFRMYSVIIANPDVGQVGTVSIQCNPATGPWTLDGPFNLKMDSAGTTSVINLPTGSYKITWKSLPDWYEPSPAESTAYLGRSQTITFSGRWVRHSGTVVVYATPAGAPWQLTDGDGSVISGQGCRTLTNVPTGTLSLSWQDLAGYDKPGSQPVQQTLGRDETITFTGIYLAQNDQVARNRSRIVQYLLGQIGPESWWMDQNADSTITVADLVYIYEHATPETPTDMTPANTEINVSRTVTFNWSDCKYATSYDFFLWKEGTSEPTLPTAGLLTASQYKPPAALAAGTVYYYRIRAKNQYNSSMTGYIQFKTK